MYIYIYRERERDYKQYDTQRLTYFVRTDMLQTPVQPSVLTAIIS